MIRKNNENTFLVSSAIVLLVYLHTNGLKNHPREAIAIVIEVVFHHTFRTTFEI